jgi:3-oxoadipate enol-lactonase
MPMIDADGCPIYVEVEGREDAPVLMLSNSLGTDLHMWDDQAAEFAKHFRLVRYDRRGHGKSGTSKGPYNFDLFGRDILKIMDALKIKKVNWCGLSMGGMDGQWLGANAPDRIEKLVLSNTNFYYADKAPWADRIKFVREKGLAQLAGPNMERWFTEDFRDRAPRAIARMTPRLQSRRLHRLRRSRPRHGLSRVQSAHHDADACHRRRAGRGHAAVGRRSRRQGYQRRKAGGAQCRAHLQCRAAERLH